MANKRERTSAVNSGRYSEVKSILNAIQGSCVPDYQDQGAFWQDYDGLLAASLYGHAMIAPGEKPGDDSAGSASEGTSCCGSNDSDNTAQSGCWPSGGGRGTAGTGGAGTSRSDQSGLIIGLRGQAPFDGSVFPALLWDAARAATSGEISTIAKWIDDGCPNDDAEEAEPSQTARIQLSKFQALACGEARHSASTQPVNTEQRANKGLRVRKEIGSLSDDELQRLRNAIACMNTYNEHRLDERSYDYWASIHANSCQHGWEQFLPWHRLYLYFFEQMLQDFDESITLPYWAWSDYATQNRASFNTNTPDEGFLPERYGCWLDLQGVENLAATQLLTETQLNQLEKMAKSGQIHHSSARFLKGAGIPYTIQKSTRTGQAEWTPLIAAVFAELKRTNPLSFAQRWPGAMVSPTSYPSAEDIKLLLETPNWSDFGGGPVGDHHFGYLEQVHNGMHNFSGGTNPYYPRKKNTEWVDLYKKLGITADDQNVDNPPYGWMTDNRITAYDPIFWAHHGNVDRIWAQWQKNHPNGNPEDLDGVLAPWSLTVNDALSTRKLGYEYMRNSYHYPVSREHGMMKFNSDKAGVETSVLDNFSKAEVRLHRVQKASLPNASIRIYLNDDNCDADTCMLDNDHFVSEVQTFHGSCYGGPGHCDLPLDKTRQFDLRSLHHNEPRNFRIDATDTVNRLLVKGEQDLSVHLVVVGLDGQPIDNALYLEGVSLNFMD